MLMENSKRKNIGEPQLIFEFLIAVNLQSQLQVYTIEFWKNFQKRETAKKVTNKRVNTF